MSCCTSHSVVCVPEVTFDIIQPSLGGARHLLKSSGPSAPFQEDGCSQDGPNMLPFCSTENTERQLA